MLNGGFTKWLAEGRPVTTDLPTPPPTQFVAHLQPRWLATAANIERVVANLSADPRLVDTRPVRSNTPRRLDAPPAACFLPPNQDGVEIDGAGRCTAAVSPAPFTSMPRAISPRIGHTAARPSYKTLAEAAGVMPEQRVILTGVGISASLGLFALHLGRLPQPGAVRWVMDRMGQRSVAAGGERSVTGINLTMA